MQLEALRGLAFIVVAWHFLWAFDPARIGIVDGFDPSSAMLGSVSFASIDGPAAVTLFFVLSGFVLPLGFFRSGRTELVVRATAKRWLRLVCLVHARRAAVVAAVPLRPLPASRGGTAQPVGLARHVRRFASAAGLHPVTARRACWKARCSRSSASRTCTIPVLWTMHHEFLGSFVTFFLAVTPLARAPRRRGVAAGNRRGRRAFHRSLPVCLRRRHRPRLAHVALRSASVAGHGRWPASPPASSCSAIWSHAAAMRRSPPCRMRARRASTGSPSTPPAA